MQTPGLKRPILIHSYSIKVHFVITLSIGTSITYSRSSPKNLILTGLATGLEGSEPAPTTNH